MIACLLVAIALVALLCACADNGSQKTIETVEPYVSANEDETEQISDEELEAELEAKLEAELTPFLWVAGDGYAPLDGEPGDKLIAYDINTETFCWDLLPEELKATSASEVGAVMLVARENVAVGSYTSGATGFKQAISAWIVDPFTGLCLEQTGSIDGGDPPSSVSTTSDQYGVSPNGKMIEEIRNSDWREIQQSGPLTFEIRDGAAYVTGYLDDKNGPIVGWLVIPEEYAGIPVVGIDESALPGVDYENLILPSSLKVIGKNAFSMTIYTKIELPDGLRAIEGSAFHYNLYLEEINIPDSVYRFGDGLFENCSFERISLPPGLRDIPYGAFVNCRSLQEIELPKGLMTIGKGAFFDCRALKSLTIPSSVSYIGEDAFEDCENLTLRCVENSVAHQYALGHGIPFELIEELPPDAEAQPIEEENAAGIWLLYSFDGYIEDVMRIFSNSSIEAMGAPFGFALYPDGRCCGLINYEPDGVFGAYKISKGTFSCKGAPFSDAYKATIEREGDSMTLTNENGIVSIYHRVANLP